jgi:hypothetical protein
VFVGRWISSRVGICGVACAQTAVGWAATINAAEQVNAPRIAARFGRAIVYIPKSPDTVITTPCVQAHRTGCGAPTPLAPPDNRWC